MVEFISKKFDFCHVFPSWAPTNRAPTGRMKEWPEGWKSEHSTRSQQYHNFILFPIQLHFYVFSLYLEIMATAYPEWSMAVGPLAIIYTLPKKLTLSLRGHLCGAKLSHALGKRMLLLFPAVKQLSHLPGDWKRWQITQHEKQASCLETWPHPLICNDSVNP